jgi:hypothetical protein
MSKPPSKPETYALTLPVEPDQLGLAEPVPVQAVRMPAPAPAG